MWKILDSDMEVAVASGFVYAPLLYDPDVAREVDGQEESPGAGSPGPRNIVQIHEKLYALAVSFESLIDNCEKIHPETYRRLRSDTLKSRGLSPDLGRATIDSKLRTILFEVMPHFVRKGGALEKRALSEEGTLEFLGEHVAVPEFFSRRIEGYLDIDNLQSALARLGEDRSRVDTPADGLYGSAALKEVFFRSLESKILADERARVEAAIRERERFGKEKLKNVALMLYLAETGSLEIDGFGFYRSWIQGEYVVYKRTGEYALMDYYGRVYLFPECRVAVVTSSPISPLVLEKYKHPFLFRHESNQKICMRNWQPPDRFSAKGVIGAIEEGINSLLYGYDYRRRNGYHRLDRLKMDFRTIDFDDLIVPGDHPKLAAGRVRVTNS